MEKYTKIFEDINKEEWSNYCTIISYPSVDNCNNPEVYLCNNEHLGFIYLKNLLYEEYNNHDNTEFCNNMLKEYSSADNLNDLYEVFCSRNRTIKVELVYCDLNDDVEIDKWIVDWELKNTASKFNV